MLRPTLLLLATLGNLLPLAVAQQPSVAAAADLGRQMDEAKKRAAAIVRDEDARAGHPLCATAANNYTLGTCENREAAITGANETNLVRALGLFYRLNLRYTAHPAPPGPVSFDGAEASWQLFRTQVCQSVADQYAGGSAQSNIQAACEISITRHHIDELWAVYKDID